MITSIHGMNFHLRKPSSFTLAEAVAGPPSENTSTNRLPALGAAEPTGAAERRPSKSAEGEGVDCNNSKEREYV